MPGVSKALLASIPSPSRRSNSAIFGHFIGLPLLSHSPIPFPLGSCFVFVVVGGLEPLQAHTVGLAEHVVRRRDYGVANSVGVSEFCPVAIEPESNVSLVVKSTELLDIDSIGDGDVGVGPVLFFSDSRNTQN